MTKSKTPEDSLQPDLKDLLKSSRKINDNLNGYDRAAATQETEEEEEEEEASTEDLTVAQLKEALDAANVTYAKDARKADLVALYDEHELGVEK